MHDNRNHQNYQIKNNDSCIWWHRGGRHWWIGPCENAGTDSGYAYLQEDLDCIPHGEARGTWRNALTDEAFQGFDVTEAIEVVAFEYEGNKVAAEAYVNAQYLSENTATAPVNAIQTKHTIYRQKCTVQQQLIYRRLGYPQLCH